MSTYDVSGIVERTLARQLSAKVRGVKGSCRHLGGRVVPGRVKVVWALQGCEQEAVGQEGSEGPCGVQKPVPTLRPPRCAAGSRRGVALRRVTGTEPEWRSRRCAGGRLGKRVGSPGASKQVRWRGPCPVSAARHQKMGLEVRTRRPCPRREPVTAPCGCSQGRPLHQPGLRVPTRMGVPVWVQLRVLEGGFR